MNFNFSAVVYICMPILLLFCLLALAALKLLVSGYFKGGGVIFRFGFSIAERRLTARFHSLRRHLTHSLWIGGRTSLHPGNNPFIARLLV